MRLIRKLLRCIFCPFRLAISPVLWLIWKVLIVIRLAPHVSYFIYLFRHKLYVLIASRGLRVSLWRAIWHDWTKYLPSEWFPYVHYFFRKDGTRANPSELTPEVKDRFQEAWRKHYQRNPHHWDGWQMECIDGEHPLEMPEKYYREMVCDWIAAGWAINGMRDPTPWYEMNRYRINISPVTRKRVETLLFPMR
jgi:hypothetical protein